MSPYSATSTSSSVVSQSLWVIENEQQQELFGSSRTGYTCGLWMLFHYLTVASQHAPVPPPLNTHDVMGLIRLIVEKLFHCRTCRSPSLSPLCLPLSPRDHFLHMYDQCLHGRCDISPSDPQQLQVCQPVLSRSSCPQIWLWSAHNDATLRILNYHLPSALSSNTTTHSHECVTTPPLPPPSLLHLCSRPAPNGDELIRLQSQIRSVIRLTDSPIHSVTLTLSPGGLALVNAITVSKKRLCPSRRKGLLTPSRLISRQAIGTPLGPSKHPNLSRVSRPPTLSDPLKLRSRQ
jgi:hypothetical protein